MSPRPADGTERGTLHWLHRPTGEPNWMAATWLGDAWSLLDGKRHHPQDLVWWNYVGPATPPGQGALGDAAELLQAECDKLTEALAAKGYPKSHVELWVGREPNHVGHRVLSYVSHDYRSPKPVMEFEHFSAETATDAIEQARAAIDAIPHPDAYAAWFECPECSGAGCDDDNGEQEDPQS